MQLRIFSCSCTSLLYLTRCSLECNTRVYRACMFLRLSGFAALGVLCLKLRLIISQWETLLCSLTGWITGWEVWVWLVRGYLQHCSFISLSFSSSGLISIQHLLLLDLVDLLNTLFVLTWNCQTAPIRNRRGACLLNVVNPYPLELTRGHLNSLQGCSQWTPLL